MLEKVQVNILGRFCKVDDNMLHKSLDCENFIKAVVCQARHIPQKLFVKSSSKILYLVSGNMLLLDLYQQYDPTVTQLVGDMDDRLFETFGK